MGFSSPRLGTFAPFSAMTSSQHDVARSGRRGGGRHEADADEEDDEEDDGAGDAANDDEEDDAADCLVRAWLT